MKHTILYALLTLLLHACGAPGEKVDQQAVQQEMEKREIKRILPGEIIEAAYRAGDTITFVLQQELQKEKSFASGSDLSMIIQKSIGHVIDSLQQRHQAKIKWIVPQDTSNGSMTSLERQLLEAYLYNVNKKMPVSDNVQRIDDEAYLYTKPLLYNTEDQQIMPNPAKASDSAIFLGMWGIHLSKKNIILDM